MPQENYELNEKVSFLKFELNFFLNFEKIWPYHEREMEKMKKKSILKFEFKFQKNLAIPP
jgi:hypothetical protein